MIQISKNQKKPKTTVTNGINSHNEFINTVLDTPRIETTVNFVSSEKSNKYNDTSFETVNWNY